MITSNARYCKDRSWGSNHWVGSIAFYVSVVVPTEESLFAVAAFCSGAPDCDAHVSLIDEASFWSLPIAEAVSAVKRVWAFTVVRSVKVIVVPTGDLVPDSREWCLPSYDVRRGLQMLKPPPCGHTLCFQQFYRWVKRFGDASCRNYPIIAQKQTTR